MNPAIWLASVCSATALLAAGCGGSGSGGPDLNAIRLAFVHNANTICTNLSTQEHSHPGSDPVTAFDSQLGYLTEAVGKLDRVTPPGPFAAKYKDFRTHFHAMVDFLRKNRRLLIALTIHFQQDPSDTGARDKFEKFIKPFDLDAAAAKNDAQALTLNACVTGLSPGGG